VKRDGDAVAGLLNGADAAELPAWSLTMLHAGIGMAFARHVLAPLDPAAAPDTLRDALTRFVTLCRASSRAGYAGAALESLGLATRTLYPALLRPLDAHLAGVDADLPGYYWHGAGRAMYFEPPNMLPSMNAPWRAVRRLDEEAPHDTARRNIVAGLAWALTVVNMRHPQVMETFLRHHGALVAADDAFTNGMTSALMMRYDTTPDDPRIRAFVHHAPEAGGDALDTWRAVITGPAETALDVTYQGLRASNALGDLFHYRPVS
jgi:hypothetical protein